MPPKKRHSVGGRKTADAKRQSLERDAETPAETAQRVATQATRQAELKEAETAVETVQRVATQAFIFLVRRFVMCLFHVFINKVNRFILLCSQF